MNIENKNNKEYKTDAGLIYSCQYHVIFCPKYRRKVLKDSVAIRLKELLLEKQDDYEYSILEMEIMEDHVHILISVNPKIGIYNVVTKLKGYSSKTLREEFPFLKSRLPTLWTRSKFISTVGAVSLDIVKNYIMNQKNV